MSTSRRCSTYTKKRAVGTNGRKVCLMCEGDITDIRRSTFCGAKCADRFYLRSRPHHARYMVFQRDKGVCAKCHINVFAGTGRTPRARGTGDLWQADHIVPVIEGGGECDLENYRTLCTACHKEETRLLAARRAEKARKDKGLPPKEIPKLSFTANQSVFNFDEVTA